MFATTRNDHSFKRDVGRTDLEEGKRNVPKRASHFPDVAKDIKVTGGKGGASRKSNCFGRKGRNVEETGQGKKPHPGTKEREKKLPTHRSLCISRKKEEDEKGENKQGGTCIREWEGRFFSLKPSREPRKNPLLLRKMVGKRGGGTSRRRMYILYAPPEQRGQGRLTPEL